MLTANHPVDVIELAWATERLAAGQSLKDIARASGRTQRDWRVAFGPDGAAFPPNDIIAERFKLVRRAVAEGASIEALSMRVRAPRSWCAEAARRLAEWRAQP